MPRPRSQAVRHAVLEAALELLEQGGSRQLTMEGIAERADVSKQTVYRWWPSPAAVLMEAVNEKAATLVPDEDLGALAADLRAFVRRTVASLRAGTAPIVATLMAKAQLAETFASLFRDQFIARRRQALRALFERARDRGEIDPSTDLDLLVDIGFGTIWYRVLNRHAPLSRRFADQLADALLTLAHRPGVIREDDAAGET